MGNRGRGNRRFAWFVMRSVWRPGIVFIRPDELMVSTESGGRAGLGDGERQADYHADRPERRVDHPQGHHAANPGNPAATSGPRRIFRRRRVRGLLEAEREGSGDRRGRRRTQEGVGDRSLLAGRRIAPFMADKKPTKADLTSVPIEHLDLEKTETIADLVDGYKHISFQARTLGLCASVLENMMTDPKCTVFFGGAGALTPGGLKKVMRDMVEFGLVDVVVTTGAIAYHDFYEAHGYHHYRSSPDADDIVLREHFLDRVYDTLADESLFRECDDEIAALADSLEPRPYSSREILWDMGRIASKDPNSLVGT